MNAFKRWEVLFRLPDDDPKKIPKRIIIIAINKRMAKAKVKNAYPGAKVTRINLFISANDKKS